MRQIEEANIYAIEWDKLAKTLPDSGDNFFRSLEKKSPQTLSHLENVAHHTHRFIAYLHSHSVCEEVSLETAYKCGIYHDIGKYFVAEIVDLDRKLTNEEYEKVKLHPAYGVKIAEHYQIRNPYIVDAILYHHEDYFGDRGYLKKIGAKSIPLIARVLALVDVYEALYSNRTYKSDLPYTEVKIIMSDMEYKFDPQLFGHFFNMMDKRILADQKYSKNVQR